MNTSKRKRIIYVAGYGRSGSTLLDTILSSHPELEGVGEIKYLFEEWNKKETLAPIWDDILELYQKEVGISLEEAHNITCDVQNPFKSTTSIQREKYFKIWSFLMSTLSERLPDITIVDSSKNAMDAFNRPKLLKDLGYEVKIIHLTRSPKDVIYSLGKKGSNRLLEAGVKGKKAILKGGTIRALINWTWVNLGVKYYYSSKKGYKIYSLKYEDFIEKTEETFKDVANFLEIDEQPFDNISQGIEVQGGIGVSGNRMRRKSKIIIRSQEVVKNDKFNLLEKGLFLLFKPFFRILGY
ncbi:MAG: sulfotransferase domain-containing protein [Saprospiraceae bacterium]